ncbi:MAG: right-handed parallel beta-helix repeat-containing protein [Spirochaetes bacterium]|nr:right-handed parallel beta-helix repeat-containing protein [Spirochaetota bacterium]
MKKIIIISSIVVLFVIASVIYSCNPFLEDENVSSSLNVLDSTDFIKASNYGEVTRSGSTYTGKVDSTTVYTGSRFFDACNACINNMDSGTLVIKNSGESGAGTGNIYAIKPKSNMVLDFSGTTVTCNGDAYIVPVQADNKTNITVKNITVTGTPRYAFWFRTCSNITFENITINTTSGLGIRVDDSKGGWSTNLKIQGNINIQRCGSMGIETYGVDGFTIGNVTANNTGECGVLLNKSKNGSVGTVTGNYNCRGGGYATFRVANSNGPNVTCTKVYSRNSGRGFFSVSGSNGTTVGSVDIANNTSHGIFLEDASNTRVNGGTVSGCNPNVQHVRCSNCVTIVNGQTYTANDGKW